MTVSILDEPMYSSTDAARFTGLTVWRVRRWLRGYEYTYRSSRGGDVRVGRSGPLVKRSAGDDSSYASFLDLVDMLVVKEFVSSGFSLQKVRKLLAETEQLIGNRHFAHRRFLVSGRSVFLQLDDPDEYVALLSGGQKGLPGIIEQIGRRVEFDRPSGLARKYYPLGPKGGIVLDPRLSFGRPVLVDRGIRTAAVHDLFVGENEDYDRAAQHLDITASEVERAVEFELSLAA